MIKKFLRILIFLITFSLIVIVYLSTVGISTNIFNSKINDQIKKIDKDLKIDLKEVFLVLEPFKFKIKLKTLGTNIRYNEEKIQIETIKSDISLKSLFYKEFSLTKINASTKSLDIKNIIKFIRLFQNDTKSFIAEKIIQKGFLIADIEINFDEYGGIKNDYKISGIVKDGKINFFKKYDLQKINFLFEMRKNKLQISNLDLKIQKEILKFPELTILKKNKDYLISGKLVNEQINLNDKKFKKYFKNINKNFKINQISFLSENNFVFFINKNLKIKNLNIDSKINLKDLKIQNEVNLKNFFPEIKDVIFLRNHEIKMNYKDDNLKITGSGNIFLQKNSDYIEYSILKIKDKINFNTLLDIKDNKLKINFLNYKKKDKSNLEILIDGIYEVDKSILLKKINLKENKNNILIEDLYSSNFQNIDYVKAVTLNYKDKYDFKNNIKIIKKKNNYLLNGNSLNINQLVDNIINSNEKQKSIIKKELELLIDVKKIFLDENNILKNFYGYLIFKKDQVFEAELSSVFKNDKKIRFNIKTSENEKVTTLFSHNAKPLVDRYKFIKGFEEGSLDFYSSKKKNKSVSTLKIYDFKLKELPALTKLLTLASLQGIADILSGEGIRFNEFEMNFSNEDKLMTIDEIYAIGPAISILMSGYVEKDKLISLRGTLVPATTLNKTIGSIPFLGEILVGKKTGEGVFGVSFKIKGPPQNLETTVNPIKTLTPRFITRTLENIKQN